MRRHAWNCDLSTKPGTDILTNRHMLKYVEICWNEMARLNLTFQSFIFAPVGMRGFRTAYPMVSCFETGLRKECSYGFCITPLEIHKSSAKLQVLHAAIFLGAMKLTILSTGVGDVFLFLCFFHYRWFSQLQTSIHRWFPAMFDFWMVNRYHNPHCWDVARMLAGLGWHGGWCVESQYLDTAVVELSAFLMCHVRVSMVIGVPNSWMVYFWETSPTKMDDHYNVRPPSYK